MTVDAGPQQISVGSSHAQMGEMLIPPIGRALRETGVKDNRG
jgi:hypothetical protein